jgi:hypothetical protein
MFANPQGINMNEKSPSWTSAGSGGHDAAIEEIWSAKPGRLVGHGLERDFWLLSDKVPA